MATRNQKIGIGGGSAGLLATAALTVSLFTGPTIVPAGANLQDYINNASSGTVLELDPQGVYSGNFTMRSDVALKSVGTRPVQAAFGKTFNVGAQIISPNAGAAVFIPPNTSGVTIDGVEIAHTGFVYNIVVIGAYGAEQDTAEEAPKNNAINNVWIRGHPTEHSQNGIIDNGSGTRVTDSRIDNIHGVGVESHGIISWNGPGPFHYSGNHVEAGGINIMFGGADPSIQGLIPTGGEILRNHLFKPLSWKVGDPSYDGIHWGIKNLLELKMARNFLVAANVLENSWGDAQIGYCSLFTVRNQDGKAPWATIEDVTVSNNTFKNCEQGLQLLGKDSPNVSERANGLRFFNNQFLNIANRWLTISGYPNVTFEHNTHFQGGNIISFYNEPSPGFKYINNATAKTGGFGLFGDGTGEGNVALAKYAPDGVVQGNVIAGADARSYPLNNFYPADLRGLADLRGIDGQIPGYLPQLQPSPSPSATATVTISPSPILSPSPAPTAGESTDGTKGPSITDSSGNKWTLGGARETLRNGQHMADGFGLQYKWLNKIVYVQGTDEKWYQWSGAWWFVIGAEPMPNSSPTPTSTPTQTPTPIATPSPTPDPSPSPVLLRKVAWPSGEAKQNAVIETQWKDRYRFKRHLSGSWAEFEKVN